MKQWVSSKEDQSGWYREDLIVYIMVRFVKVITADA